MAIKGTTVITSNRPKYRVTTRSVCLYWQKLVEVTKFYMSSKETNQCYTTSKEAGPSSKSTQRSGQTGNLYWVCWQEVEKKKKTGGWTEAECKEGCVCAMEERGTAPSSGDKSFDKKLGIDYNDDGTIKESSIGNAISKSGEQIVESLIKDENRVPAGWEVRRWDRCTPAPNTFVYCGEGVTK